MPKNRFLNFTHVLFQILWSYIEYCNKKFTPQSMLPFFKQKEEAIALFKKGDYENALKHYEHAVEIGITLTKNKIDFYDNEQKVQNINYEIAVLKYNQALIYHKQYEDKKTIKVCEEAFVWIEKEIDDRNEKLKNLVENKYYVSLLKIGQYEDVLERTKNIQKSKELALMLKRLKYDEFEKFFKEIGSPSEKDKLRIMEIMEVTDIPILQKCNLHFTRTMIKNIIFMFLKGELLPESFLISVLKSGYSSLINQDNIQSVISTRAYIFGDTHGQFLDTLAILSKIPGNSLDLEQGLVLDKSAVFIFNGDFVDRGPSGIENFVMLLLLKLLHPQQVYLNRGNHEFEAVNIQFGFTNEIFTKYNTKFRPVFQAFVSTFTTLPLCTVLNNEYFIVHGGLPQYTTTLDIIREKNRFVNGNSDEVISCLMWSDPDEIEDWKPSHRGMGVVFGKSITQNFLTKNSLKKIIRSHEFVENGYRENHSGLVATIFSAPNYCGSSNDASYIEMVDGEYKVIRFEEYVKDERFMEFVKEVKNNKYKKEK